MSPIAAGDGPFPGLSAQYRLVTPLYLGGASQQPELRAASLKGVLRSWYRAVDPHATRAGGSTREAVLFGSGGKDARQALAHVRVRWGREAGTKRWQWNREGVMREFTEGSGSRSRNGFVYLGWPFHTTRQPRDAFAPGAEVEVRVMVPRWRGRDDLSNEEQRLWRGLLASLWMLGRAGAMGSRARRGFGGLELEQIDLFAATPPALAVYAGELPAEPAANAPAWTQQMHDGVHVIRSWLGDDFTGARHPHLGPRFHHAILPKPHTGPDAWRRALDEAGRRLQDFRQRRRPDYDRVKQYLIDRDRNRNAVSAAPERAAFGLPLAFRYGSLRDRVSRSEVTFVPATDGGGPTSRSDRKPPDRHGSLLLIRLVQLRDGVHPAFIRLDGEVPGSSRVPGASGVRVRGGGEAQGASSGAILDEFMGWVAR